MDKISVNHLYYVYNNRGTEFCALNNLNFSVREGEFISIIGHSGCGKSTLLKIFAGLFTPTAGEVLLDGKKMAGPDTGRAVVFQEYSLFPWMTALKNVSFGIRQANKSISAGQAAQMAMKQLEKVGMGESAHKYPFELSGGMRQRVAIARALAMDADVLLLDEPFGALDAKIRMELQDMLLRLRETEAKKKTVVFITHDVDEAILLSDRVLFMRPGEIIADRRVPFGNRRNRIFLRETRRYKDLREELMGYFYMDSRMLAEPEEQVV